MSRRVRLTHTNCGDFKEARLLAGLTRSSAATLLHVSIRTVRNWENSRSKAPYPAFELMRILSGYELPGEAWRGWRVKGDMLWSPEGRGFQAERLAYWGLTCAMARQWQQEQEQRQTFSPTDKALPLALSSHEPAAQAGDRGPAPAVSAWVGEREPVQHETFKQRSVLRPKDGAAAQGAGDSRG